jgi:F-type H+-transporting ATPase subunit c
MKKSILVSLLASASGVLAQATSTAAQSTPFFTTIDGAAIIAMAIASVGCALAQGNAIARAMEGIARQPEAAGKIQGPLLIGLGFIESLAIYVLVIALILIFANPATPIVTR